MQSESQLAAGFRVALDAHRGHNKRVACSWPESQNNYRANKPLNSHRDCFGLNSWVNSLTGWAAVVALSISKQSLLNRENDLFHFTFVSSSITNFMWMSQGIESSVTIAYFSAWDVLSWLLIMFVHWHRQWLSVAKVGAVWIILCWPSTSRPVRSSEHGIMLYFLFLLHPQLSHALLPSRP